MEDNWKHTMEGCRTIIRIGEPGCRLLVSSICDTKSAHMEYQNMGQLNITCTVKTLVVMLILMGEKFKGFTSRLRDRQLKTVERRINLLDENFLTVLITCTYKQHQMNSASYMNVYLHTRTYMYIYIHIYVKIIITKIS